ncbi:MAG TPA: helix-turn-helix domain-containing protein [Gemmatimonadales bacterium]|jgi:DeoR family suf operon transcriptional repressor|nr:helix-turn-helix domain-containing protein [Gemmatimonadales bacterium]
MAPMVSSGIQDRNLPPGYSGVRGAILVELKKTEGLTTRELASRLGTSINAIRHHLKELERLELVQYERQHHGVGAPSYSYRITKAAEALFPRGYESTLSSLLQDLVQSRGRAETVALLEARYARLAQQLESELSGATQAERLQAMSRLLTADGFMAEVTSDGSTNALTEHNCAIQAVAEQFPEICAAEAQFLSNVLRAEVRRERHILKGCSACEYHVRFDARELASGGMQSPGMQPGSLTPTPQENS